MKNKVKIKRDKKNNFTYLDYYKVEDIQTYRYDMIKGFCKDKQVVVIINTNLGCIEPHLDHKKKIQSLEKLLQSKDIRYTIVPTQNNKSSSVFGIIVKKEKKELAYKLVFTISGKQITEDFFKDFMCTYDIEMGIELRKSIEETFEDYTKGFFETCFDPDYFINAVYDSIFVRQMKTNIMIDE